MKSPLFKVIALLILISCPMVDAMAGNNATGSNFALEKIDAGQYKQLRKKFYKEEPPYDVEDDFNIVREMLDGLVEFDNDGFVLSMSRRDGKPFKEEDFELSSFVAYYPDLDILYLAGEGDPYDNTFNLTTGEVTDMVGEPTSFRTSPSGKYRLCGYWDGAERSYYFIQENKNGRYRKIGDIDPEILKNTSDQFWSDDHTLYFELSDYDGETNKGLGIYYKLTISE